MNMIYSTPRSCLLTDELLTKFCPFSRQCIKRCKYQLLFSFRSKVFMILSRDTLGKKII